MKSVVRFLVFLLLTLNSVHSLPSPILDNVTDISGRVGGGGSITIANRNFQVALNSCGYVCGGSLIRNNLVVTAAHCTYTCMAEQITVRAGSVNFASGGAVLVGLRLHQHPEFDSVSQDFDISLLELSGSFTIGASIGVVPLQIIMPPDTSALVISGYGSTTITGAIPNTLMSGTLQLSNYGSCNLQYRGTLTKSVFCAHSPSQRACPGDEGGPITFNGNLLGVISFGTDCAAARTPAVFTSIPALAVWINQILAATA